MTCNSAASRASTNRVQMSERSTDELLATLSADVDWCYNLLKEAQHLAKVATEEDVGTKLPPELAKNLPANVPAALHKWFEYHARQLFRTAFACIEGFTYTIKTRSAAFCLDQGIDL